MNMRYVYLGNYVNKYLIKNNFYGIDFLEQKKLVEQGLLNYTSLYARGIGCTMSEEDSKSLDKLLDIIDEEVSDKKEKDDLFDAVTFYVKAIAENMQGYVIVWKEMDDDSLKSEPQIIFDKGKWEAIDGHYDTPAKATAKKVLQVFKEEFKLKNDKILQKK